MHTSSLAPERALSISKLMSYRPIRMYTCVNYLFHVSCNIPLGCRSHRWRRGPPFLPYAQSGSGRPGLLSLAAARATEAVRFRASPRNGGDRVSRWRCDAERGRAEQNRAHEAISERWDAGPPPPPPAPLPRTSIYPPPRRRIHAAGLDRLGEGRR